MTELILEEHTQPGVTVLTLNRPEKRNALNIPLLELLCAAIARATVRDGQRVLVIRGAGPVFCAGLDLREAQDSTVTAHSGELVRTMLESLYRCPCVTVSVVQGAALAGGAGLMAACDIAVTTMDTTIGFPEVHRGLVAGLVMTFLRRQLPERHAREMLLLGELINGERAAEIGLVTRAVPSDLLEEAADQCIAKALKAPPGAIRETKALLDALWHHHLVGGLDLAHTVHTRTRESAEAREGMAAFLEKRKPRWEG